MAKKRKTRSRRKRVTSANSNRRLRFSSSPLKKRKDLRVYEDRREFHPIGEGSPARSFSTSRHRLKVVDQPKKNPDRFGDSIRSQTKAYVAFEAPKKVLVCVRRKARKEVLHALKKTGRVGQKKPRRSEYSNISCRS